jgi:hypothetical protein
MNERPHDGFNFVTFVQQSRAERRARAAVSPAFMKTWPARSNRHCPAMDRAAVLLAPQHAKLARGVEEWERAFGVCS